MACRWELDFMSTYLIALAGLHWRQLLHLLHGCCSFFAINSSPFMFLHGCLLLCCSGFVCSCYGVLHGCAIICELVFILAMFMLVLHMAAAANSRKVPSQRHITLRRALAQLTGHKLLPGPQLWLKCNICSDIHPCEDSLLVACRLICRGGQPPEVRWTEVLWQQVVAEVRVTGRTMIPVIVHVCAGLPLHMPTTHSQAQ